jgi:hypothetical protein
VRAIQNTPACMVEKNGTVNYGTYRAPFRKPNILDAPLYRFNAPVFWKNFRLKEWQHFAIITPTHYLGTVIFDAKLIGVSFFYVYDRRSNELFERTSQKAGHCAQVTDQIYNGVCQYDSEGYHVRFDIGI